MKKIIPLSLITVASIYAAEVNLSPIGVEATTITEVSQKARKSADLAEALSNNVPSVDMSRRSGIANDVFIRGQKRDNISVEVDGTKVCGACPNRMDPPTSHILASQISEIEVIEGPYDVETFGTMSGGLKIKTKKPSKKVKSEINVGFGSWDYQKIGVTVSGGNDAVRVLISGSKESSGQYKDGNGDSLVEQTKKKAPIGNQYKAANSDVDSYDKKSLMAKAFITTADNQELRLSLTANRSDNILYPNSGMDAVYDNSNIYSVEYNIDSINDIYKNINLQYYYSEVDHPMNTALRNSSNSVSPGNMTNQLQTSMQGLKLKNNFKINNHKLLIGLDGSKRTWDGGYTTQNIAHPMNGTKSINNAETENLAVFAKLEKTYGDFSVSIGARYDYTDITNGGGFQENDYSSLNANIFTTYNLNSKNKLFLGFGQASRVPDGRELYFQKGSLKGTPTLDKTTNRQIDFGYEAQYDSFSLKAKGFYSMLDDFIYYQKGLATNNFKNIDATIYGGELSASFYATDEVTIDASIAYKKGEKDNALAGQTDKDLADMAPLRGKLALNYEYKKDSVATIEGQFSDTWDTYDADNGEQEIDSWNIVNLKVKHAVNKKFDLTLGINNLFDETYAVSNTYADLTLLAPGVTEDVMLLNEPGRYIYTNLTFKF